ncbi:MAG TPA: FKBP-type peptidyl-prolyl cis-trans isomerase [Caulobacteraceae bacterium]|nr:FKBP-type peptidyl-prolyl cis-trans isomerase [Caulobacteraceae bacterium]
MHRRQALSLFAALALAACGDKGAKKNLDEGAAFLAKNRTLKDIHTTASGLQYRILRSGPPSGIRPKPADEVKVHYEGKLLDGHVFDSSYERGSPAVMRLRGLIPGWVEALQLMRPGDEWQLYVPARLGYGEKGAGGEIPPNAVLVFKIELIDVLPDETSTGKA